MGRGEWRKYGEKKDYARAEMGKLRDDDLKRVILYLLIFALLIMNLLTVIHYMTV